MKARLLSTSTGQGCATPTPTYSPTATFTPTPTPTGTWYTATPTVTPTGTPANGLEEIVLYPNPVREGSEVRFWVNFPQPVNELSLRVYTVASRLVLTRRWTPAGSGEYAIVLRDAKGKNIANGVYYVKFETNTKEKKCKLLILR